MNWIDIFIQLILFHYELQTHSFFTCRCSKLELVFSLIVNTVTPRAQLQPKFTALTSLIIIVIIVIWNPKSHLIMIIIINLEVLRLIGIILWERLTHVILLLTWVMIERRLILLLFWLLLSFVVEVVLCILLLRKGTHVLISIKHKLLLCLVVGNLRHFLVWLGGDLLHFEHLLSEIRKVMLY